jgi:hypothetical protein
MVSNGGMIVNNKLERKDLKGSSYGIIQDTALAFA